MGKKTRIKSDNKSFPKWIRNFGIFLAVFVIIGLIGYLPGIGFLRYYIDGYTINRTAFFNRTSEILWENPLLIDSEFNQIANNYDATISSDGTFVIISHKFAKDNTELYISYNENGLWTEPFLLDAVNSEYEEKNPALSYDGKLLYFSSNRPGGKGGFDILCSVHNGKKWSKPFHLGGAVNSKYDDENPSISALKDYFFFSSNRPHGPNNSKDFNIYRAARIQEKNQLDPSGPPAFKDITYLEELNTSYNEGKLVLTPRGSLAYFASDRPGGEGGYDLYQSHFFRDHFTEPVNFGLPVNSEYDEISPTLTMEGFKIYVTSNRFSRNGNDYRLYESLSRQVIAKVDYTVMIALFLLVATIMLVYYLMKLLLSDVNMKILTRCLLASLLIHLILLLLSSAWFIGGKIKDAMQEGPEEMTINMNNLARENINVAIREGIAALPKVPSEMPSTQPQYTPAPSGQRPVNAPSSPVSKSVAAITPVAIAESDNVPQEAAPAMDAEGLTAMKPSILGHSTLRMEAPKGNKNDATGSSKGKGRFPPKRQFKPTPMMKQKTFEMKQQSPAMILADVKIDATEDMNKMPEALHKKRALKPAMRKAVSEASETIGDDIAEVASDLEASQGTRSISDSGMFVLFMKMKMEERKKKKDNEKLPELGLLDKDTQFMTAKEFELLKDEEKFLFLKYIKDRLKRNGPMTFNSFLPLLLQLKEQELTPVDDTIYKSMIELDIPADSELEVPENYTP